VKRLLDLGLSLAAAVLFLPFGLVIAAVLLVTGEGEVFYRQERVGLDGRRFGLLKFATMLKKSPSLGTGTITLRNDPRVLPIGRFLRKTKLNEVPQVLNVLAGDMSLVGPRPLTPQTFGYYTPDVQREIVRVRPGLTGVGSIAFRDEESILGRSALSAVDCYRDEIAPRKGRLELWYIRNRTFWLDVKIILVTAAVVVSPKSRWPLQLLADAEIEPGAAAAG
jgi:lipopolysaccharide/colanic/teichoic acid biosynthesis glycosyltransferase